MIKNNVISIIITSFCLFIVSVIQVFAIQSWDVNNTQTRHGAWSQELKRWDSITATWYDKIKLNQYMPQESYIKPQDGCEGDRCWENSPTKSKYCIKDKCWESNSTMFKIVDFDENIIEIWKNRCAMTSDWFVFDGNKWNCSNGNQINKFIGQGQERWESNNFGQKLLYINEIGDKWSSNNFGQGVMFDGINGEKWNSNNFRQKYDTKKHF